MKNACGTSASRILFHATSSHATHVCNAIACRFACRFYFRVNEMWRCVPIRVRLSRRSRRNVYILIPHGRHVPYTHSRDAKRNEIPLVFSSRFRREARCKAETWNRRSIRRHSFRYALFRVSSVVVHNYWRDRETGERRLLPRAHDRLSSEADRGCASARAVLRYQSAPLTKASISILIYKYYYSIYIVQAKENLEK